MSMTEPWKTPFECIDPSVGEQIWRLEQPGPDSPRRAELEAHLSACHACRLAVDLDAKARELARSGRLERGARSWRPRIPRLIPDRTIWIAGFGLAASLAAVIFLPPRPVADGSSVRGRERIRFLRPVEGEVVAASRPVLRWTPIPGASRYSVEIRDRDGDLVWECETSNPSIRPPADVSLRHGRGYKALLSVQPADLLPPGRPSVFFRSDSPWRMVLHRLRWTHPFLQVLMFLSLALTLALGRRLFRRG